MTEREMKLAALTDYQQSFAGNESHTEWIYESLAAFDVNVRLRNCDGQPLTLDHSIRPLLAPGDRCLGALSHPLATSAAISNTRHRGGRRVRIAARDCYVTGESFGRTLGYG